MFRQILVVTVVGCLWACETGAEQASESPQPAAVWMQWIQQQDPAVFVSAFMAFVGSGWIMTLAVIGRVSGWQKLARRYPVRDLNRGTRIWIGNIWFRFGGYRNLVYVKADESHLHFRMILRLGHPPFSVPWSDVSAKRILVWGWSKRVQFNFASEPDYPFKMLGVTADRIIDASRGRVRITEAPRGNTPATHASLGES
jgi:hypothetical protein